MVLEAFEEYYTRLGGGYSESSLVCSLNNEMYLFEVELIDMQLFDEMMGYKCQQLQMEQEGYVLEGKYNAIDLDKGSISSYSYDSESDKWTKSTATFKEKGFFEKIWAGIKKILAWFIKTIKTIWYTIISFFSKVATKIKFFFSSVKDYKPTPEDLKFQVTWCDLNGIKKMYDAFMKVKTFAEVSDDALEYVKSAYHAPTFQNATTNEVMNGEDMKKEAEANKKEIGQIPELSSPKAVMEVTIQLKDIIRRLESRSNTIIAGAARFEERCKSAAEKTDLHMLYSFSQKLSTLIVKSSSALLECFKINLKAATSTMAHFVECQKKSKKSESEAKSESFIFDYDYQYQW